MMAKAKFFEKRALDSRLTSPDVTAKEKWLLLSAPLVAVTGILLFTVPSGNRTVQVIWVMLSYNLFYSFAYAHYDYPVIIELTAHLLGLNTRVKVGMTTINDFTIKY